MKTYNSPLSILVIVAFAAPVSAVPPPPPPIGNLAGPGPLCQPTFAFMLAEDESADQFHANHWVINGPTWSLGIRAVSSAEAASSREALRGRQALETTFVPGLGEVERHRVLEYPGNRQRGWAYWIPPAEGTDGTYVLVASDHFDGTEADHPRLLRVRFGEARAPLCAP